MNKLADISADPSLWSAQELSYGFRQKRISPVEAIDAVLARIDRQDESLNAFCLLDPEAAREAARASQERWEKGVPIGPLDGIPASIKDIVLTRDWPTLRGSKSIDANQDWSIDGPATARLREAGAVLFGKTTTPEFANKPVTISPLTGITRNPWNPELTPGGSSGGAGAAVASGMGPLALGTDAGGSIRIPSSLCGIFGHKPTGGRVPVFPLTPYGTFAAFGPMARTVADAARMLNVLALPDPRDWNALPPDGIDYEAELDRADPSEWTIAFSPTLGYARLDSQVRDAVTAAVERFAACGARIVEVDHVMDDPTDLFERLKRGLTDYAFKDVSTDKLALMENSLAAEIEASRGATLYEYLDAEMERAALGRQMIAFHQEYDLLITPTLAQRAFDAELDHPEDFGRYDWMAYTYPFNLTRQPAASLPCGVDDRGMPIGLQIVGPLYQDRKVLQAARVFETMMPWADRWPDLTSGT